MPPLATADTMAASVAPIADRAVEMGVVLYIDAAQRLVGARHVGGDAGSVDIAVRTIAIDALALGAASVVMAHNHPSGDAAVSRDDLIFTRRLATGLAAIEVELADHLVLAPGGAATSMRAKGFL